MRNERIAFGDLLRQFRVSAALSQEALAERSGLSRRGISDLERGLSLAPRLETVRLLTDALALGERDQQALLTAARPNAWQKDGALPGNTRHDSLPSPLTRLIGREMETAALLALLDMDSVRLLTVTGSGGTGKTRLALEVAASVRDRYEDGVVFVDLTPLIDPGLVPQTRCAIFTPSTSWNWSMRRHHISGAAANSSGWRA